MQTLVLMRYSYFGASGWQSQASRDPDILLSKERLTKRFQLLRDIALPSLAAQTDPDFKLIVLSSRALPSWRQSQLTEICKDMLGDGRADVIFRRPGSANNKFRDRIREGHNSAAMTCQVVLDDDDALSRDFIDRLRPEAEAAITVRSEEQAHAFVSFPQGVTLRLGEKDPTLYWRDRPFTNLGLSLVAPTGSPRTVIGVAHKKIPQRHPARVVYDQRPSYVRTVHDSNDSRALYGDMPVPEAEMPAMITAFPCLSKFFPQVAPARTRASMVA